jgi:tetratricopeptide (TPR) repeat protein
MLPSTTQLNPPTQPSRLNATTNRLIAPILALCICTTAIGFTLSTASHAQSPGSPHVASSGITEKTQELLSKLRAAEQAAPESNPYMIAILAELGSLCQTQGHYDDAERYLKRAYDLSLAKFGKDNSETATQYSAIGKLYAEVGRYQEAERILKEALETYRRINQSENATGTLAALGQLCYQTGKYAQSVQYYGQASEIASAKKDITTDNVRQAISTGQQLALQKLGRDIGSKDIISGGYHNEPIRNKWALVVGISKFKDRTLNNFALGGANRFYSYLTSVAGFPANHVVALLDENATRQNILEALGDKFLPWVAQPEDLVVLYISTHGSASSSDVVGLNYLVAHDTDLNNLFSTAIPTQYLSRTILERIRAKRVIIVLDACFSGSATGAIPSRNQALGFDAGQIAQASGQVVLTSSAPGEYSVALGRDSCPLFTKRLTEGLQINGRDTTLRQGFDYAQRSVLADSIQYAKRRQTPVMKSAWTGDHLKLASASYTVDERESIPVAMSFPAPATPARPAAQTLPPTASATNSSTTVRLGYFILPEIKTRTSSNAQTISRTVNEIARSKGINIVVDTSAVWLGGQALVSNGVNLTATVCNKLGVPVAPSQGSPRPATLKVGYFDRRKLSSVDKARLQAAIKNAAAVQGIDVVLDCLGVYAGGQFTLDHGIDLTNEIVGQVR